MWATWLKRILQSHRTSRCICTHTYTHIFYQAYEVSPQPQCHHWFRISAVGQYLTLGFETSLWKDSWPPLPHWISGGCGSTAAPKIWMNITKPATRWNGLSQNLICYWIVWWRFPKSREYHQIIQSLDHDLVLKQPCWLGDPPFSETTILNPHWTVLFNGSSPPVKWSPFHQHPSRWWPNIQIVHDHPIRRNPADGDRWEVMACPAGAAPKVPILRWEEYQPNIFNNNVGPQVMFVGL